MVTDLSVGDAETPVLTVDPSDGTTAVTLRVTAPDGNNTSVPVNLLETVDTARTFIADTIVYTQPALWVLTWTVAGQGVGVEQQQVWVTPSPVAGGPLWTPGRSRVANYITGRTIVASGGRNVPLMTFDETTRPTGTMVDQLIADAVDWVSAAAGTVAVSLYRMASACAALYAAWAVELSYPDRNNAVKDTSTHVADRLLQRAVAMRADLVAANAAAGEAPSAGGATLLPLYSFPDPPSWADLNL